MQIVIHSQDCRYKTRQKFSTKISRQYTVSRPEIIDVRTIAQESQKDKVLRQVIRFIKEGWPKDAKQLTESERKFFYRKDEINIEQNCLMWGYRVIIPTRLREAGTS